MTDRQRRAKIKESMDQLKALVPLETNQKADQATIVAESVDMIKAMKEELAINCGRRLLELELKATNDARRWVGDSEVLAQTEAAAALLDIAIQCNDCLVERRWRFDDPHESGRPHPRSEPRI